MKANQRRGTGRLNKMRNTFTHIFGNGRAVSLIICLNPDDHTYQPGGWKFSDERGLDGINVAEWNAWIEEVDGHIEKLGFELKEG
jgi:hypothetical protein